jgi:hypothetical protein
VYVQPFPAGLRIPISTTGGVTPRWRADGKELFYLTTGKGGLDKPVPGSATQGTSVMSVDVQDIGSTLKVSAPRVLFEGDRLVRASITLAGGLQNASQNMDVSANGQRFLMLQRPASTAPPAESPLTVTLNWMAGLPKEAR